MESSQHAAFDLFTTTSTLFSFFLPTYIKEGLKTRRGGVVKTKRTFGYLKKRMGGGESFTF